MRARGRVHVACLAVPRIDLVLLAEPADAVDARGQSAARANRRLRAVELGQPMQLVPPAAREPAVAAARAAATDVLLENRDPEVRIALRQEPRSPETGETAADDRDVGGDVLGEWRGRRARPPPPGVAQAPPAP